MAEEGSTSVKNISRLNPDERIKKPQPKP